MHELNNELPETPVIFMKSTAALRALDAGGLAFSEETFHHEIELVLLVGEHVPLGALSAAPGTELECVRAVGLGLDLTRRGVQTELKKKGLPWTIAKSFAGSALLGPCVANDGSFDLQDVSFELAVNGEVKQAGHVEQMIFPMARQLAYLNSLAPLLPGDLVFTGTPEGVGALRKGDRLQLRFLTGPDASRFGLPDTFEGQL